MLLPQPYMNQYFVGNCFGCVCICWLSLMSTISLFDNCFGCVCMYVVSSALCRPEVCLENVMVVFIC